MAYSILIVDDEDVIREGLKQVISWEELGFTIVGTVSSGEDALRFLEHTPVDVLFTDIRMPRISGIELARLVKLQYPETRVVILSGYDNFSYAQNAIRYGVYHYLLKPCAEEEIIEVFTRLHSEIEKIKERRQSTRKLNRLLVQEELSNLLHGRIGIQEATELHTWRQQFHTCEFVIGLLQLLPDERVFTDVLYDQKDSQFDLSLPLLDSLDPYISDGNMLILNLAHERFFCVIPVEGDEIETFMEMWYEQLCTTIGNELPLRLNALFLRYSEGDIAVDEILHTMTKSLTALFWHKEIGSLIWTTHDEILHNQSVAVELPDAQELVKVLCSGKGKGEEDNPVLVMDSITTIVKVSQVEWLQTYLSALKEMVELNGADFGVLEARLHCLEPLISCCVTFDRLMQFAFAIGNQACKRILDYKNRCYSKNIRDAIQIIDERFGSNLNLEELSRELGLTATYLSKLFKREVGINFKEYVLEKQMLEAKRLLRESNDKIYEIAEAVGFSDQHYFSDVFKRSTSLTPLEYRKVGAHE